MHKKITLFVVVLLSATLLVGCAGVGVTPDTNVPDAGVTPEGDIPPIEESIPPSEDVIPPIEDTSPPVERPEEVPPEPEIIPPVPLIVYDTWLIVTSNEVNVREQPTSNSRVVGRMRRGEGLALVDKVSARWYKTYYKGKQAYISSGFVREISTEKSLDNNLERVILEGKRLLGYPYVWGSQRYHWGNGVKNTRFKMGEFDCSALMQYMFYKGARIYLDVTTRTQVVQGVLVTDDLRRGDLMFFTNAARRHKKGIERVGHVGLYLGNNYILHTADEYAVIEEISATRWANYLVSKRFF